jgi:hypothetical protein
VDPIPQFDWFELMFQDDSQSPYWKEHFCMQKDTFHRLVNLVAPEISKQNKTLRKPISTPKCVAIALWRLVCGDSFRDIATHFDVEKSTCVTITKKFCQALNILSKRFIKFPVNCRDTTRAIALFQDDCRIPQAVGEIDGTHIEMIAPENPFDYFDRPHRYSVTMQAVEQASPVENELCLKPLKCSRIKCNAGCEIFAKHLLDISQ